MCIIESIKIINSLISNDQTNGSKSTNYRDEISRAVSAGLKWQKKKKMWRENEERDNSKIIKLKSNAEKQTHPNCRKIYPSDYANEVEGVKG